jgi:phospholipid/cholesterol/gamma-HCH transport system substrate-binding protein
MNRLIRVFALAVASALAVTSCASITINALPQPGGGQRNGYDLIIEFDSVLNLPDRARVVMGGRNVGVVTKVALASSHVDVVSRIDADAVVPSNIHAVLQQATVLGDIYVALEPSGDGSAAAPPLGRGARIPLSQTTSPPQLEDTIANLANFVSSGSIQRVQSTIIGINRLTPPRDEIHTLASRVAADLTDLSKNMDLVDQWLQGVSETAEVLYNRTPTFQQWFTPMGMGDFFRAADIAHSIGILLPSVGSVFNNGYWLVPLLRSLSGSLGSASQTGVRRRGIPGLDTTIHRRFSPSRQVSGNKHHINYRPRRA